MSREAFVRAVLAEAATQIEGSAWPDVLKHLFLDTDAASDFVGHEDGLDRARARAARAARSALRRFLDLRARARRRERRDDGLRRKFASFYAFVDEIERADGVTIEMVIQILDREASDAKPDKRRMALATKVSLLSEVWKLDFDAHELALMSIRSGWAAENPAYKGRKTGDAIQAEAAAMRAAQRNLQRKIARKIARAETALVRDLAAALEKTAGPRSN